MRVRPRGALLQAGPFALGEAAEQLGVNLVGYVDSGFDERAVRRATHMDVAIAALGFPLKTALRQRAGDASYHTTASFPALTLDALNKSMRIGYLEAPTTWQIVMSRGAPARDFKDVHRIQVGALPYVPIWLGNTAPDRASFGDEKATYAVEAYAMRLDFGWKLLVNDDMSVLTRLPNQLGRSMARTVNAVAWAVVTGNPTMTDGQALFLETPAGNRKRSNLTTGAGAPAVATVQTLSNKMAQMRGLNTPEGNEATDILGLQPRYIIGPSALRTTITQLVRSPYDPADANMKFNTASELTPVIEPLLDVNSPTAWYLAADKRDIDGIEVTFLQGQEEPMTWQDVDERSLTRTYSILQCFAASAIEYRGWQKHAGV